MMTMIMMIDLRETYSGLNQVGCAPPRSVTTVANGVVRFEGSRDLPSVSKLANILSGMS